MEVIRTEIEGVVILRPRVFTDARGYFFESFNSAEFAEKVGPVEFVQDNESASVGGVIRGLHFQKPPYTQAKLVRCTEGRVLDIAVDLRAGSPTYGSHVAVELTAQGNEQLFIPEGFAHGFAVLTPHAVFQYKCSNLYHPEAEGSIAPFDPDLAIEWPFAPDRAILSDKDMRAPLFSNFISPFKQ